MAFLRNFDFDKTLDKTLGSVSKLGNTVLDLQMKRALLEEQRDRTSVETAYYVPGPMDASYQTQAAAPVGSNINLGGMEITPMQLGLGALVLFMMLR